MFSRGEMGGRRPQRDLGTIVMVILKDLTVGEAVEFRPLHRRSNPSFSVYEVISFFRDKKLTCRAGTCRHVETRAGTCRHVGTRGRAGYVGYSLMGQPYGPALWASLMGQPYGAALL